jgi:hypothetical protein
MSGWQAIWGNFGSFSPTYSSHTIRKSKHTPVAGPVTIASRRPAWLRRSAAVLGAIYLACVWLDASGTGIPTRILPLPLRFFVQEAALFPKGATEAIEWRVEGWSCDTRRFAEIDVRPFFPIRRDDKESRFFRAMFFHHRQRKVLEALDAFITREQNVAHPDQRIGGVLLLSLRIPIPPPGTPEPRYRPLPLPDYPREVERHVWYTTAIEDRTRRCTEMP